MNIFYFFFKKKKKKKKKNTELIKNKYYLSNYNIIEL